jgi:hypothetical protein
MKMPHHERSRHEQTNLHVPLLLLHEQHSLLLHHHELLSRHGRW